MNEERKIAKEVLDLGFQPHIYVDPDDSSNVFETAPSPELVGIDKMIAGDHRYSLRLIDEDIDGIITDIGTALEKGSEDMLRSAEKKVESLHPFFSNNRGFEAVPYICRTAEFICCEKNPGTPEEEILPYKVWPEFYRSDDTQYALDWYDSTGSAEALRGSLQGLSMSLKEFKRKVFLLLGDSSLLPGVSYPERMTAYILSRERNSDDLWGNSTVAGCRSRMQILESGDAALFSAIMDFDDTRKAEGCFRSNMDEFLRTEDARCLNRALSAFSAYERTEGSAYIETFSTPYLEDILDLEIYRMVKSGACIRRCNRCGRLYIMEEKDDGFCRVPGKDGALSCQGAHLKETLGKEADRIYNTAYKTHFARIKAGTETKEDVDRWREEAKDLKEKIWNEALTLEQYRKFIGAKL